MADEGEKSISRRGKAAPRALRPERRPFSERMACGYRYRAVTRARRRGIDLSVSRERLVSSQLSSRLGTTRKEERGKCQAVDRLGLVGRLEGVGGMW